MPKIIENLRETLIGEARRQIGENGYAATTIRSVASACGVGVGTVYNYFPSKDMLIAAYMLEEWQATRARMAQTIGNSTHPEQVLRCIYDELLAFARSNSRLFSDNDASAVFASSFTDKHRLLRDQIAGLIQPLCEKSRAENKAFLGDFIAESLLSWTMAGQSFSDIYSVVRILLYNEKETLI